MGCEHQPMSRTLSRFLDGKRCVPFNRSIKGSGKRSRDHDESKQAHWTLLGDAKQTLPGAEHVFHPRLGGNRLSSAHDGSATAELLKTLGNISISGIFPSDPPIGFQRFRDATERFESAAKHIENL